LLIAAAYYRTTIARTLLFSAILILTIRSAPRWAMY
jgi:hypothetical protein